MFLLKQVVCGRGYSIVATTESELYFWGSKGEVDSTTATLEDVDMQIIQKRQVPAHFY